MAPADPPPQEEGTGLPRAGPVYELLPVEVPRREGRCPPGPRIRRHPARARRRSKGPRFRFTIAGLMILIALLAPAFAHPRAVAELTALTGFVALIVLAPLALTVLISRALGTAARATLALTDAALDETLARLGRLRRLRSPGHGFEGVGPRSRASASKADPTGADGSLDDALFEQGLDDLEPDPDRLAHTVANPPEERPRDGVLDGQEPAIPEGF